MLITDRKPWLFKLKEVWFSDKPYDVGGCTSVEFIDCKGKVSIDGFECIEYSTLVIDLTQDLDTIWSKMGKKSCRYEIKRAVRDGVQVERSDDYVAFDKLNRQFRKAKGLGKSVGIEYMRKYGTLFLATIDNELVAGQLYLEDESNIRWLLGVSTRLESDNVLTGCANRLLIWEAIKYAKAKGIKEFDFGGYYSGDDNVEWKSIGFFKQTFGGVPTTHYIYAKSYLGIYAIARRVRSIL